MAGNPRDWAPPPGSTEWEREAARYERALEVQLRERYPSRYRRRRRLKWLLMPLGAVAVLTVAAVLAVPPEETGERGSLTAPTTLAPSTPSTTSVPSPSTSAPESVSENTTNPPQADLNGDTECVVDEMVGVVARGTLTNHSSGTSWYTIHVSFNDAAGVRFAEAPTVHNDVRAGETVRWEAKPFKPPAAGAWTCEVVSIERFASQ